MKFTDEQLKAGIRGTTRVSRAYGAAVLSIHAEDNTTASDTRTDLLALPSFASLAALKLVSPQARAAYAAMLHGHIDGHLKHVMDEPDEP